MPTSTARQHRRLVQEALLQFEGEHLDDFDTAMRAAAIGWLIQPHGSYAEQVVYLTNARSLVHDAVQGRETDGMAYFAEARDAIDALIAITSDLIEADEDERAMEDFGLDFRVWSAQQKTHVV
jgi:hypothetical protein